MNEEASPGKTKGQAGSGRPELDEGGKRAEGEKELENRGGRWKRNAANRRGGGRKDVTKRESAEVGGGGG